MYGLKATSLAILSLAVCLKSALAFGSHKHNHNNELHSPRSAPIAVGVTGEHAFKPPTEGQQRGPCPALNSLANHAYISRDGIASLLEVVNALTSVLGVGADLATILAVLGVFWAGDPMSLSFSIGGPDRRVHNTLSSLLNPLGTGQGLDFSHNAIEADSSPTRNDLFVTGDAATMNLTRFERLYDLVPAGETFTLDVMKDYAVMRFNESIGENPHFYYGPFTGAIARNAGFIFIARLLADHPDGNLEGTLTHDTLESFFAVTGPRSNFTYNRGFERIPENWHSRPSPYGIAELTLDAVSGVVKYPVLASIGGNLGSVNSFAGIDLSDPVYGLSNIPSLLESNNLMCFALEIIKTAAPSYTNNLFSALTGPLTTLFDAINTPLLNLGCPEWDSLTYGGKGFLEQLQDTYPGARNGAL